MAWLQGLAGAALRVPVERVPADCRLSELGLDSLAAVELSHAVQAELGLEIGMARLLAGPTLEELAAEIEAGLRTRPRAGVLHPLPEPAARERCFPLTHGQRALWFLDRLAPGSTAYVIGGAARVRGRLDGAALESALYRLGERHPALRTTFAAGEDGPVQRVAAVPAIEVVEADGSGWSAAEESARVRELLFRPFDLEHGPLVRLVLVRRGPNQDQIVALALHHIVADFWSLGIVVRELGALYARELGAAAELPPAPAEGPGEAARREAERLAGPAGERLWDFWRAEVAGFPLVLELPADRPRPAVPTYGGAARRLRLPGHVLAGVQELARARGATPYVALLAGFGALLARLSGQERLLVGSPTAGRGPRDTEVVGYLVHPLPIACEVAGERPFGELVARLRGRVLAAFAHQEMPFPLLAERLQPEREASRPPVFQAMFVLQKERPGEAGLGGFAAGAESRLRLGGVELDALALAPPGSPFDLSLTLAEVDGELAGRFVYDPELFDGATVERWAGHFAALLAGAVAAPERPVGRLDLFSAAERHQLLVAWQGGEGFATGTDWVAERWEALAAQEPGAPIVECEGRVWTRGQLEARANRLARRLLALGAGPERLVGVLVERSFDQVAGLLAVLKAGAGYLALDPELPDERLAALVREGRPAALLCGPGLAGRVAFAGPVAALEDGAEDAGWSAAPPGVAAAPESLAYVLYTSGSTGVPKGVAVPRAALDNILRLRAADLGAGYRTLLKTSIGFDVSIIELFVPLVAGGQVVLAPPGGQRDMAYLARVVAEARIAATGFAPAVFEEFLALAGPCPALRRMASGIDVLPPDVPGRFAARFPGCGLFNCYGPTEATVYVLEHRCGREETGPRVPIGRPVAGAEVHLLDARLEPVPVGVPGELCIGGVCLARGYLGRPDLTAERFVPHPLGGRGGRLYRTGDLGRQRADGELEFLGRLDRQVKIRGFRVEPGEVEAALAAHPAVAEAAVVARAGRQRDLAAFVVPRPGAAARPADLRAHLAERLPAYMVPAAFATLDTLPLSAVGKVDRRELERRAAGLRPEGAACEAPRTPVEELLAGIWAGLLGVDQVGRRDGFFHLGGHSLLATRLAARVRQAFGVELPLRAVFEAPALADLAAQIEALRAGGAEAAGAVPALPRPPHGPAELPASFAQERLWFLERLDPGRPTYNLPARLRLQGELDVPALAAALAALVRRHEALRTVFAERPGGLVQVIAEAPPAAASGILRQVDLGGLAADRQAALERLAAAEARRPFDLAAGPLLRAVLARLAPHDHALFLTLHHAVADGWSIGILARELGALYRAARTAGAAPPPPALQYADFAAWQRERLAGSALAPALAWWRERLVGAPAALDLPCDRPRPPVRRLRGRQVPVALPAGLTARLAALGRQEGATLFMTVLAGFAALLARWAAADEVVVGAPVAGRTGAEVEGTVGMFVNSLVLRLAAPRGQSFAGLLAAAREVVLAAHAHQEVPFERLVQELAPERDLSRNPLFQVMLAWEDLPLPPGASLFAGLEAEVAAVETGVAKLDLTLALGRRSGPGGAALAGFLEIDRDLFDAATAVRLGEALAMLLAVAAGDPGRELAALPLLSAGARHQLLREWNDALPLPPLPAAARTLPGLFAARAAERPQAVALVDGREAVSWADLAARSRLLAGRLARLGVRPEVRVGLCAGRSAAAVAGILGILGAGGVYVPLDPSYPAERLALLIAGAQVELILADEAAVPLLSGLLASHPAVRVVPLAGEPAREAGPDAPRAGPGHLAYVIFTSGSTGVPKGVGVTHGTAVELGVAFARVLGLGPADRLLQFAPLSFDASIAELVESWATGATLHLAPREALLPGDPLARLLRERAITAVTLPPSALAALPEGAYPDLELLVVAGEACPAELAARWMKSRVDSGSNGGAPGRRLVNAYGPTETTVCAAAGRQQPGAGPLTLGRPLPHQRLHLLDAGLRPVLPGAVGEIFVSGGLARGYLGRPDATAERFVPDPFAEPGEEGARLYRTGDLGRRLAGGEVVFVGRADRQVKVRGFRIEPAEIEEALARCPGVREAAVLAEAAGPGELRLAACVAGPGLPAQGAAALREDLRRRLPEHLVPARFVLLEELPVTPSGKVDRAALAALRPEAAGGAAPAPPQTEAEQMLAEIWAEVLGLGEGEAARLGVHDDFFDLGGHSLSATRVLLRVRETLGVEVPVRRFFAAPTIAELAVAVAEELIAGMGEGERSEILAELS